MWMPLGYQWFLFWETLQDGMTICIIYIVYIYMELQKKFGESLIDDELQKVWTVAASLSYCMFEVNF